MLHFCLEILLFFSLKHFIVILQISFPQITVFRCSGEWGEDELDQTIMTALFKVNQKAFTQGMLEVLWNGHQNIAIGQNGHL